jgi:hypothetical protein
VSNVVVYSQITDYNVKNTLEKRYNKTMEVFYDWGEWYQPCSEYICVDCKSCSLRIQISENVILFKDKYSMPDLKFDTSYRCKYVADEPAKDFPFFKKVEITMEKTNVINGQYSNDKTYGHGYVYSTISLKELLLKNGIKGIVYMYYEMDDGKKGYIGYELDSLAY